MTKTPRLSIIVPVYNTERLLSKCIDSILNQTNPDFELLLIDDGSKDNSGFMCDEYARKDQRVKVFHQENKGVGAARNAGLSNACGTFITFIDSDDWIEPDYTEFIIRNSSNADITYFDEIWHCPDKCTAIFSSGPFNCSETEAIEQKILQMLNNTLHHAFFGFTWNKVFLRKIIEENSIRFIEKLSTSEDEVFTHEYCKHVSTFSVCTPSPIYHYNQHSNGLTNKKKTRDEWLLLGTSLAQATKNYQNSELKVYLNKRIRDSLALAAAKSKGLKQTISAIRTLFDICGSFSKLSLIRRIIHFRHRDPICI